VRGASERASEVTAPIEVCTPSSFAEVQRCSPPLTHPLTEVSGADRACGTPCFWHRVRTVDQGRTERYRENKCTRSQSNRIPSVSLAAAQTASLHSPRTPPPQLTPLRPHPASLPCSPEGPGQLHPLGVMLPLLTRLRPPFLVWSRLQVADRSGLTQSEAFVLQ